MALYHGQTSVRPRGTKTSTTDRPVCRTKASTTNKRVCGRVEQMHLQRPYPCAGMWNKYIYHGQTSVRPRETKASTTDKPVCGHVKRKHLPRTNQCAATWNESIYHGQTSVQPRGTKASTTDKPVCIHVERKHRRALQRHTRAIILKHTLLLLFCLYWLLGLNV